jgi:transcriptional regulator NrdR family protein
MNCPSCGSSDVRSSRRSQWRDTILRAMGRESIRCRNCRERFYVSRSVALKSGNPLVRRPKQVFSARTRGRILRRIILVAVFTLAFMLFWFLLDKIIGAGSF